MDFQRRRSNSWTVTSMTGLSRLNWDHMPAHGKSFLKGSPKAPSWDLAYSIFFINDIFYFIVQSILYNYADDNTLSFIHKDLLHLKSVLEQESQILISWFDQNLMKANPDKFQAMTTSSLFKLAKLIYQM